MNRNRPLVVLAVGLGVLLVVLEPGFGYAAAPPIGSRAATPSAPDGSLPAADPPLAVHRLVLACAAGETLAYSGVQRVEVRSSSGSRTSTVVVSHAPGDGVQIAALASAGNVPRTLVAPAAPSLLPVVDEATMRRISSRYRMRGPYPGTPVAGRATDVVDLLRTTGGATGTVAARFWLDRQTSLPLQRQVLDGSGAVQQASSFVSISFQAPAPTAVRTRADTSTTDAGEAMSENQLTGYRSTGWLAPERLPDEFELVDVRMHGVGGTPQASSPPVLQLSYTDGIAVLSLFEQKGRLDPAPVASWLRQSRRHGTVYVDGGTPERAVWSAGGSVYTLVSDDPAVVDAAMSALPAPTARPSFWQRLGHGVHRVLSWLNPFG